MSTTVPLPTISTGKARAITVIGWLGIIGGIVLIIAGGVVWGVVSSQLSNEKITVSADSPILAGSKVDGPLTAFAQANIINHHALEASKGKTYAQLGQDDPVRETVMDASFLRASLFTSVVSFGVAVFAIGMGIIVGLFGWALTLFAPRTRRSTV